MRKDNAITFLYLTYNIEIEKYVSCFYSVPEPHFSVKFFCAHTTIGLIAEKVDHHIFSNSTGTAVIFFGGV